MITYPAERKIGGTWVGDGPFPKRVKRHTLALLEHFQTGIAVAGYVLAGTLGYVTCVPRRLQAPEQPGDVLQTKHILGEPGREGGMA